MPRISPYQIMLNKEDRAILEAISKKYTSSYNSVIRAKIILMAAMNYDNKQIGEKLDLPRQIVSKWRKRFFYEGISGLQEQPRRGRPRGFSPSSSHGN